MIELRTRNFKFRGHGNARRCAGGGRAPGRRAGILASALRIGMMSALTFAVLSCSDSPNQYSPLGDNNTTTPVSIVIGTVLDMNVAPVREAVVTLDALNDGIPVAVQALMYEALGRKQDDGLAGGQLGWARRVQPARAYSANAHI